MRVFIDADACPVKNEALKVAERYDLPVFIVSNGGMRPSRDPRITCCRTSIPPPIPTTRQSRRDVAGAATSIWLVVSPPAVTVATPDKEH